MVLIASLGPPYVLVAARSEVALFMPPVWQGALSSSRAAARQAARWASKLATEQRAVTVMPLSWKSESTN